MSGRHTHTHMHTLLLLILFPQRVYVWCLACLLTSRTEQSLRVVLCRVIFISFPIVIDVSIHTHTHTS